jgi:glutamine cyclotransferase
MNAIAPLRHAVKSTFSAVSRWRVPIVEPTIIAELPHDPTAFTQGLAFHGNDLYESTGGEANSSLRRLNSEDGRIHQELPIDNDFAEGIAIVDQRLFQLSWKSGVAREFSIPDLRLVASHRYTGEGWGLATRGRDLVSSDGSSRLRFWTPQFRSLGSIRMRSNCVPIRWLNDLECVGNRVFANVVDCPFVIEASLDDGQVARLIDCRCLMKLASPLDSRQILNGIAYRQESRTFYLTGKLWRSMFVVSMPL